MGFELPAEPPDLVSELMASANLREIQVKSLQGIAVLAARKLDDWRAFGADLLRELNELEKIKISEMASDRLKIEQQQQVARALHSTRDRLMVLMQAETAQ